MFEAIIYFPTNQGDYIYFKDFYVEDKEYLFPIDEAYKVSEFFEENNIVIEDLSELLIGGKLYPKVDEYESAAEFEIKPLKVIYYMKVICFFVLYIIFVFVAVTLLSRKNKNFKK